MFYVLWNWQPFKWLVCFLSFLFLIFFLIEVLGQALDPESVQVQSSISVQGRPNIFGRFTLFLGKVEGTYTQILALVLYLSLLSLLHCIFGVVCPRWSICDGIRFVFFGHSLGGGLMFSFVCIC